MRDDEITQLQAEKADLKEQGDVAWEGLNSQVAELQAENEGLRNRIETFEESSAMDARIINQWAERYKDLQAELDMAKKLSQCPCCHKEFKGEGYTETEVHFVCIGCGGHLQIDKKIWNKIIHPNLPVKASAASERGSK